MELESLYKTTQNTKSKKKLIKTMDRMWHILIFKTYGERCVICGKPAIDAHHVIRKSQSNALRYNVINGVPLCKGCHTFGVHVGNVDKNRKLIEYLGNEQIDNLQSHKHDYTKMNISTLREKAIELYKEIKEIE